MPRRGPAIALAALLLAACQTGPGAPLLSPAIAGQDYGYTERPLGDHGYAIDYLGPRGIAPTGEAAERSTEAALQQASDFALWRAAQLAKAQGYAGFRVVEKRAEMNTHPGGPAPSPVQCGPFQAGFNTVNGIGLGGFAGDYGHSFAECNRAGPAPWIQAHAAIEVELLHSPAASDYVADTLLQRLQQAYPGADHLPYQGPT